MMVTPEKKPDGPTVPFNPSIAECMKDRFVLALVPVIDARGAVAPLPPEVRPSAKAKHIFDFVIGLRVVVSMDKIDNRPSKMHVSASVKADTPIFWRLENETSAKGVVNRIVLLTCEMIDRLAGFRVPLEIVACTGAAVIHLLGPTRKEYNELARKCRQQEIPDPTSE